MLTGFFCPECREAHRLSLDEHNVTMSAGSNSGESATIRERPVDPDAWRKARGILKDLNPGEPAEVSIRRARNALAVDWSTAKWYAYDEEGNVRECRD